MMEGKGETLTAQEQELASRWAFKTALMLSLRGPNVIPADHYTSFGPSQELPDHVAIWIAASVEGRGFFAENHELTMTTAEGPRDGYAMTIRVGHLVFHILSYEWPNGAIPQVGGQFATLVVPIWPIRETVMWPPPALLTLEQANTLSRRIPGYN